MGTTPPLPAAAPAIPGAVPAEPVPMLFTEPAVDFGDSDSLAALPDEGVVAGVWTIEFFRDDFFDERVEPEPTLDTVLPLPRFRFLITSVLSDNGRTTPCSFRKRPQALHKGWPSGFRRQSGVVWVKQLVQVVGWPLSCPGLVPPGLTGLEGAAELKPDSGGELGEDIAR